MCLKIFSVSYNTVKGSYVIYHFILPHALQKPNPSHQMHIFFSSAANICQLKTVSGDVGTGLRGLRGSKGISR